MNQSIHAVLRYSMVSFLSMTTVIATTGVFAQESRRALDSKSTLDAEPYRFTIDLHQAASPIDNPLKGLVPYARPTPGRFPHSMEFGYLPLSKLMLAEKTFDWAPLESLLNDIASRGNQSVLRIYLEYPGKTEGIPQYLLDAGLKVHRYQNTNTAPFPPKDVITPDYEDPRLHRALEQFIAAFGQVYDNDPRLAYVTAGLLGTWGEWHTYPRNELWASKRTQEIVLDAYEKAFHSTPVLLRYPAGPQTWAQAANAKRPFGYHDDSFCWATLETGKSEDSWFYIPALKSAGSEAVKKWQTSPIGGEIRPEVWGKIFDDQDQWPDQAQDFQQCVSETHATWLLDTGMFREQASQERLRRATSQVRSMGYDFFVRRVKASVMKLASESSTLDLEIELHNNGVAPFYADWPTEIGLVTAQGKRVLTKQVDSLSVRGRLPGTHRLSGRINLNGLTGKYTIVLRVVQPLPGGKPLRFANVEQGQDLNGWLTLGSMVLRE